jgi:hypothetical protein
MVSKNPSSVFHRGVAAAVLFLALSTLAFTSVRAKTPSAARQHAGATKTRKEPAPPADPAAQAREATAKDFVEETLHTWQERMNLTDWNIEVELVRETTLEPKTLGNIHWDTGTKQAVIQVLSSYDYPLSFPETLDDMEFTVVHELVHLDLASLPRSKASRTTEEHAVNKLADALLNLAKKK